jgi:hypothetical protein
MTHNEFDHLRGTVKSLTPEQMRQLRQELESELVASAVQPSGPREEVPDAEGDRDQVLNHGMALQQEQPAAKPLTEEQFKQQLLESGLMICLPTPTDPAARPPFQPVKIEGEPLSEMIIRERR